MSNSVDSDINLRLPNMPLVPATDVVMFRELSRIYDAFRILQTELSNAKARIAILEQYNTTNP